VVSSNPAGKCSSRPIVVPFAGRRLVRLRR
jgi:hypothetical protein